jgi:allantoin racemase
MIEAVRRSVHDDRPDAVVLAGFGNVGVYALKEVLEVPVCSISESSMAMACLLGHRFSTLTMLEQFIPYQQDLVRLYGFEAKCASVRAININVEEAATDRDRTLRELTGQVKKIVSEDQAEVIILACAGLCDYDRELTEASGVPVIDPVVAAVKTAESFVAMGLSHSKVRKFHSPPQPLGDYQGPPHGADQEIKSPPLGPSIWPL